MNAAKTFLQKFANDWTMNLTSMFTYSLITTIFPLLLGILTIASLILGILSPSSFDGVVSGINGALPQNFKAVIDVKLLAGGLKSSTGILAVVSLAGLVFTGSNLFTNLENAFSVYFRTRDRDFLPQRLMAVGMVIILAVLLPLALAASSLVTAGSSAFQKILPQPLGVLLSFVGPLVGVGVLFVLFLAIYRIVPNIAITFGQAWKGALTSAILFGLVQILFPLYFKVFLSGNAKYGALAASVLVLLTWLWLFALITMIGAQVNAVAMGIKPLSVDLARTVAADYEASTQPAPAKRRRGPLPRPSHVAKVGAAAGSGLSALGRLLAPPLRFLTLLGWLLARPVVQREGRHER